MQKILTIVFLLVLAAGTYAQSVPMDWQTGVPVVNSSRASALGHTEMFGALDGTAMFANPAWMADTHDLNVEIGVSSIFGKTPYDDPIFGNSHEQKYLGSVKPEYAVASMPLRIHGIPLSLAVGAGIWTMHRPGWDQETTWEEYSSSIGGYATYTDKITYDGLIQLVGPAVAADLFDMLYAGLSIGTSTGGTITVKDEQNYPGNESSDEISYSPSFQVVTLSAVLRPNKNFKLGVMMRPAYEMTFGDVVYNLPSIGFSGDGPNTILSMPETIGASFSLTSADQMIELVGEYQSRQLSKIRYGVENFELSDVPLDDGQALRLGLQLGAIQAGYFMEDVAVEKTQNERKPAVHKGFTFGLGYRGHRISLHAFGEYGALEYDRIFNGTTIGIKETIWRIGGGIGIHLF
ncbi:MAG: hypothetical protein V2A56_01540 [bacterium]